jgi:hypothetical protein
MCREILLHDRFAAVKLGQTWGLLLILVLLVSSIKTRPKTLSSLLCYPSIPTVRPRASTGQQLAAGSPRASRAQTPAASLPPSPSVSSLNNNNMSSPISLPSPPRPPPPPLPPSLAAPIHNSATPLHSLHPPPFALQLFTLVFHLYSSIMLFSGARPTHARKMFSSIARCFGSAFTTGVPRGTSGALVRYDSSTEMGWNPAAKGTPKKAKGKAFQFSKHRRTHCNIVCALHFFAWTKK